MHLHRLPLLSLTHCGLWSGGSECTGQAFFVPTSCLGHLLAVWTWASYLTFFFSSKNEDNKPSLIMKIKGENACEVLSWQVVNSQCLLVAVIIITLASLLLLLALLFCLHCARRGVLKTVLTVKHSCKQTEGRQVVHSVTNQLCTAKNSCLTMWNLHAACWVEFNKHLLITLYWEGISCIV